MSSCLNSEVRVEETSASLHPPLLGSARYLAPPIYRSHDRLGLSTLYRRTRLGCSRVSPGIREGRREFRVCHSFRFALSRGCIINPKMLRKFRRWMPEVSVKQKIQIGFEHPSRCGFIEAANTRFERGHVTVNFTFRVTHRGSPNYSASRVLVHTQSIRSGVGS